MMFAWWKTRAVIAGAVALAAATGCRTPSNQRDWSPNQAVLSTADFHDNQVTIRNIRNTEYRTAEDYTVRHYDKTFDLEKLDSVDFIVVPFPGVPGGAHTFVSFGFDGTDYVAISIEVRREKGEEFNPVRAMAKQPEIMYVVGDERDLIGLRSNHWLSDVYMYRARATRSQMQALFKGMLARTNQLADEPEFYNLITNNCTTNIMRHVNELAPDRIPYTYQVLMPAYSARLAHELDLIRVDDNFERTKQQARINERAYVHRASTDFSIKIRDGHPTLTQKSWDSDGTRLR